MTLSEKIIYYRKKAMLSQEALAEKLGVSRQAISKWETGDATPEVSNLSALASALGVSVDHLLSSDDIISSETPENKHRGARWFFNKYSWILSAVVGAWGLIISIYGTFMRASVFSPYGDLAKADADFTAFLKATPIYNVGTFFLIFGIIVAILGAAATFILKRKQK